MMNIVILLFFGFMLEFQFKIGGGPLMIIYIFSGVGVANFMVLCFNDVSGSVSGSNMGSWIFIGSIISY